MVGEATDRQPSRLAFLCALAGCTQAPPSWTPANHITSRIGRRSALMMGSTPAVVGRHVKRDS